jgi:hypothetical protein
MTISTGQQVAQLHDRYMMMMMTTSNYSVKTPQQNGRILVVISANPETSPRRIAIRGSSKEQCGKSCMHSFSTPNIWQAQGLQQTNHLPRKTFSKWFLRKHAGNL